MPRQPSSLPRELITGEVLAQLKTASLPVGDMGAPEDPYGWQSDNPNEGTPFIPYMSLSVGAAGAPQGAVGDSGTEWETRYSVAYVGVTRTQTEAVADKMRLHLVGQERVSLHHERSDTNWRITQYRCDRIGAIQKITGSFPDYYTQLDEFVVRVSKEKR